MNMRRKILGFDGFDVNSNESLLLFLNLIYNFLGSVTETNKQTELTTVNQNHTY